MRRAALITTLAAMAALPFLGGCVPQDKYDQLLTANRSLQEQLVQVEEERDMARGGLNVAQVEMKQMMESYDALQSRYNELSESFSRLEGESATSLRRISKLELGPLPLEVQSALEELAMAHPDVLYFDPQQGMLRFSSDFTFDLGSADLRTDAFVTIQALAGILNEPSARSLEARIVGHTDSVRIGKPETRALHPTNMHLSVHRSISVRDALTSAGVSPTRLQVAGYGEFRPVVPNNTRGAAENRRVEIYLVPMPESAMRFSQMQQAEDADSTAVVDPAVEEPMK
jgi:chemotaxis protein MotB